MKATLSVVSHLRVMSENPSLCAGPNGGTVPRRGLEPWSQQDARHLLLAMDQPSEDAGAAA